MVEGMGRARHIDAPDAVFLFADQAARFVGVLFQSGDPVPQGLP